MYFKYNSSSIYYNISGEGFPIVLLHGFLESSTMWNPIIPSLSKKNKVISIDLPGHGKSDCIGEIHSMGLMAEVVHTLLEQLNIPEANFTGHSLGGYVALAFTEKYETKVKQLILLNSTTEADSLERKKIRDRAIKVIKTNKKAFVSMAISNLFSETISSEHQKAIKNLKEEAFTFPICGIVGALKGMRDRKDRTSVLKKFTKKKIFIAAAADTLIPFSISKIIAESCNTTFIKTQGGHMSMHENPFEINKLLSLYR